MSPIPDEAWQPIRDHLDGGLSDAEWELAKQRHPVGSIVRVRVLADLPMGPFVAIEPRLVGQIEAPEVSDEGDAMRPPVGNTLTAVVLDHKDANQQIRLSSRESTLRRAGYGG